MENDCTFYYFKPRGKWKYEGRGRFPRGEGYYEINHDSIFKENNGMPGISSNGKCYTIIVIPDESCDVSTAYPHMIKATEE